MNDLEFSFELIAQDEKARLGKISTYRGNIDTPAFMPVGTLGTVKSVFTEDLSFTGTQIILGNTYHLMIRPGTKTLDLFGGLHNFMNWQKPILTDSGGFQIMSLAKLNKIDINIGAVFSSHIDGRKFVLSPEKSIQIQKSINSDILMVLDECPRLTHNKDKLIREKYFQLGKEYLYLIAGNELVMQKRINLSIQLPNDKSSLLPIHSDTWSGDSPYEVVLWIPLVNCYSTKSMYILPPKYLPEINKSFSNGIYDGDSEKIFKKFKKKVEWINIKINEVLIFNQNLPHGNVVNLEPETRWSLNCRFKSIFSPYGDKKIGEFFEPITLRAISQIGMNYKYPDESKS